MSKESYARGFVKAAAAAGVDPTALAKFAQEFKTNGWAPKVVTEIGTKRAPIYGYDDESSGEGDSIRIIEKAKPIEAANEVADAVQLGKGRYRGGNEIVAAKPRAAIDPIYSAWLSAHTKAVDDIYKKIEPFYKHLEGDSRLSYTTPNSSLAESIAKAYHDSMAKSTGGVSRVSAPKK